MNKFLQEQLPAKMSGLVREGVLSECDFIFLRHDYELNDRILHEIARRGIKNLGIPRRQYLDVIADAINKYFQNTLFVMHAPYIDNIMQSTDANELRHFQDGSFNNGYCDMLRILLPILCKLDAETALAIQEYDRQQRHNVFH